MRSGSALIGGRPGRNSAPAGHQLPAAPINWAEQTARRRVPSEGFTASALANAPPWRRREWPRGPCLTGGARVIWSNDTPSTEEPGPQPPVRVPGSKPIGRTTISSSVTGSSSSASPTNVARSVSIRPTPRSSGFQPGAALASQI